MVGRVATMRVSSVMVEPSSERGTLKSTRMKTCLFLSSISRMESLDIKAFQGSGFRNHGVRFDFDAPTGVKQGCYHDHGGCGADSAEDFTVDAANSFPVFGVGEKHAGTDDVLEGC